MFVLEVSLNHFMPDIKVRT